MTRKRPKPYIPLEKDRVVHGILARGLLEKQEIRICAFIWVESWGWGQPSTNPDFPITVTRICEYTGMHERPARRIWKHLIARKIILDRGDRSFEFNEHSDTWERTNQVRKTDQLGPKSEDENGPIRSAKVSLHRTNQVRKTDQLGPITGPIRSDPLHIPSEKYREVQRSKPATPFLGPSLSPVFRFSEVYEILNEIDVPAFQKITGNEEWERDLAEVIDDPEIGLDLSGLITEAKKFRTWFESKIEVGKIKRVGRHEPRQRFINNWVRKIPEFREKRGGNRNDTRHQRGNGRTSRPSGTGHKPTKYERATITARADGSPGE